MEYFFFLASGRRPGLRTSDNRSPVTLSETNRADPRVVHFVNAFATLPPFLAFKLVSRYRNDASGASDASCSFCAASVDSPSRADAAADAAAAASNG